jgi:hypothetical protein
MEMARAGVFLLLLLCFCLVVVLHYPSTEYWYAVLVGKSSNVVMVAVMSQYVPPCLSSFFFDNCAERKCNMRSGQKRLIPCHPIPLVH